MSGNQKVKDAQGSWGGITYPGYFQEGLGGRSFKVDGQVVHELRRTRRLFCNEPCKNKIKGAIMKMYDAALLDL